MEPLGAVASVVTLAEALGQTCNALRKLSRRIKNAPQEFESLKINLELLRLCIKDTQPLSSDLGPEVYAHVAAALQVAGTILASLDQTCERHHLLSPTTSRLNWALLKGSKMEMQLAQLGQVQATLQSFLQITGLQRQYQAEMEVLAMRDLVVDLSKNVKSLMPQPDSTPVDYNKEITRKPNELLRTTSDKSVASDWLRYLGMYYSLLEIHPATKTPAALSKYSFAFQVRLPFGIRSLVGQVSWTKHPMSNAISLVNPSSFSISRLVNADSEGFEACHSGDLASLKKHLASGIATLGDVTPQNWTLMTAAITGGNVDMVQFLIDNGMDVNVPCGINQTSYIQSALNKKRFDVARCLLENGADVNYVSLLGWNALFYCWPKAGSGMEVRIEEVELLSKHDHLDVDLIDRWGWSILQRLAAYGSAIDVRKLIQLGAGIHHLHMPFGWPAIFHAAHWGNLDTFNELLRHYPKDIIYVEDVNGWTLLHVTASAGQHEVCRRLLQLGSDPLALSKPAGSLVAESIRGLCCTPSQVAAAEGLERLQTFRDILREFGFEFANDEEEEDEEEGEFVDAFEDMPLL